MAGWAALAQCTGPYLVLVQCNGRRPVFSPCVQCTSPYLVLVQYNEPASIQPFYMYRPVCSPCTMYQPIFRPCTMYRPVFTPCTMYRPVLSSFTMYRPVFDSSLFFSSSPFFYLSPIVICFCSFFIIEKNSFLFIVYFIY